MKLVLLVLKGEWGNECRYHYRDMCGDDKRAPSGPLGRYLQEIALRDPGARLYTMSR